MNVGKLCWAIFGSVDGYYAGPHGEFIPPAWSDDMNNRSLEIMAAAGHLIYGRVNYEWNRDFWMQAEADPESDAAAHSYAHEMNAIPKTMVSASKTGDPGWNGTIVRGDLEGAIARLKADNAKDIYLLGSGVLAQSLMERDLIDEYQLLVIPHVQGDGMRIFTKGLPALGLTLAQARPFDTGAVLLRYIRNRED